MDFLPVTILGDCEKSFEKCLKRHLLVKAATRSCRNSAFWKETNDLEELANVAVNLTANIHVEMCYVMSLDVV